MKVCRKIPWSHYCVKLVESKWHGYSSNCVLDISAVPLEFTPLVIVFTSFISLKGQTHALGCSPPPFCSCVNIATQQYGVPTKNFLQESAAS